MNAVRLCLACAVAALAAAASADIIHLKTGKVEGIILQRTETELVVETTAGKVTLNAADVVKIERKSSPLELYREMAREVKADDAEGHYKLGQWCLDAKLFREANNEFRKTIELAPDHEGARERLGYVRKDGQWMTRTEAKQADGLVRHEGRWMTEEEREKDKLRDAAVAWRKRFLAAATTKPTRTEVVAERLDRMLGQQPDKAAIVALRSVLRDLVKEAQEAKRDATSEARVALAEAVGDREDAEGTELLRWASVADPDDAVRSVALEALRAQGSVDNTAYYVGLLRDFSGARFRLQGDKKTRALARRVLRRSAEALGQLDDARAVPALANAMVVVFHIPEQQREDELPPMNIGFSNTTHVGSTVITDENGNQFVVPVTEGTQWNPGNPDPTEQRGESGFFFNDAAYNALRKLTKQDFGHDKRKWLAWWYKNRNDVVE